MIEFTRSEWVLLVSMPVLMMLSYAVGYCQGRVDEYRDGGVR
jgi:general stress protein CsbA